MSVTVATANWNGFWGKYGDRWTECVRAMSPAPDRVIVASDEPIKTDFDVVICHTKTLGPMRNAAIEITDTDWFVPSDLDDIPLPNYVDGLHCGSDIHAFSYMYGDRTYGFTPSMWTDAFSPNTGNPIASCSAYKTELAKKVKYRDIGWEDWAFWLDMKKTGATVHYDPIPRWVYMRPPNSLSQQDVARKEEEILRMKIEGVW